MTKKYMSSIGISAKDIANFPSDDNKIYGYYNGEPLDIGTNISKVVYVDSRSTKDTEDGTMYFPFKTLTGAISFASSNYSGSKVTFKLAPGSTYSGNPINLLNYNNWDFVCDAVAGETKAVIGAKITFGGDNNVFSFRGLQISDGIEYTSSVAGNVIFDDVVFGGASGLTSAGKGDLTFNNCKIGLNSTFAHNGNVEIRNSTCNGYLIKVNSASTKLELINCKGVTLYRLYGIVNAYDTVFSTLTSVSPTYSIASNNTSGSIKIFNGISLTEANVLAPIKLIGTASYYLGSFVFKYDTSSIVGAKIEHGLSSIQLYDYKTRDGYSVSNNTLEGHLDGISATIGDISEALDEILG